MQISKAQITPDSIVIKGIKDSIKNISEIKLSPLVYKNVKESIIEEILIPNTTFYKVIKQNVKITIPVEAYTEKTIELAVYE